MIRKIMTPTDFSPVSSNAVEYAVNIAQRMNATLTLFHVQPVPIGEGVSLFSLSERESVKEIKVASDLLENFCSEITNTYKVSCNYEIAATIGSFEKTVEEESSKYDLVIIGTNGADSVFQFYFGSHSFRIAKNAASPVLIIPDGYSFSEISNIVFASNYNGQNLSLHELKIFTDEFKPHIQVLNISEKDTPVGDDDYLTFCNATKDILNSENISFERVVHVNDESTIEHYARKMQPDLLAVCIEEHDFLYRLFHKTFIKDITSIIEIPILIFHK